MATKQKLTAATTSRKRGKQAAQLGVQPMTVLQRSAVPLTQPQEPCLATSKRQRTTGAAEVTYLV